MHSKAIEDYKKNLIFTQEQRETLVGVLLGDACLETQNRGRTYRVKFEQSAQHEAYVRHLVTVVSAVGAVTSSPEAVCGLQRFGYFELGVSNSQS